MSYVERDDGVMVASPCWDWFELSYAPYMVLQRVLLCGMPLEWQQKFVALLEEMEEVYDTDNLENNYCVQLRDDKGRFKFDKFRNYRHFNEPLPYRALKE